MKTKTAALFFVLAALSIGPAGAQDRIDVSALVTKSDAEVALGEAVEDPKPHNSDDKNGYASKCIYRTLKPGKSLVLSVRKGAAGASSLDEFEALSRGGGKIHPVTGLGDKAGFFAGGKKEGLPGNAVMLYAVRGDAFVTVAIGGLNDEAAVLEKAKALAQKILARL